MSYDAFIFRSYFKRLVFGANSRTFEEAEKKHIQVVELFEQLDPKDLIREYKVKGEIDGTYLLDKISK